MSTVPNELKKIIDRRYETHKKRKSYNGEEIKKIDIEQLFYDTYKDGFKCYYCKCQLKLKEEYPYPNISSLDHIKSLDNNGTHDKNNLCVCCVGCNLIKGLMDEDIFRKMLSYLPENFYNELKLKMIKQKLYNKLDRLKK